MAETELEVEIEERLPFRLAGLKVRTGMASAKADCQRLWGEFVRMMPEAASFADFSYGVSVMIAENEFDYWAGLPLDRGRPVPAGLAALDVPGGVFAACRLSNLESLPLAYKRLYGSPLPGFEPSFEAPCYEQYPADYAKSGLLTLYAPVRRKERV
ncbi:MAG: GyrI-like domain-containing protein [Candidatus Adiutrix sp.]|nr:GyrI-like domain-containing protein [Candidatus Adiutrix sp.]